MHQHFKFTVVATLLRKAVKYPLRATLPALMAAMATPSMAFQIDTEVPDLKLRWDTTVGYGLGFRTAKPLPVMTEGLSAVSFNDGNLNFAKRRRPITNRFDLFTEADLSYRSVGARISAAAWYDDVYNRGTSNASGLTSRGPLNQANTLNSGVPGQFPDATADLHGNKAEVLDAFVFGNVNLGTVPVNVRLGRHALSWGETVFFGANGIAAGMSPVDIVKLQSAPNATVKETTRPTNQLSVQAVVAPGVSVAAYYQLAFEKSRSAGVGSYFSTIDTIDTGGSVSSIVTPANTLAIYNRLPNQEPSDDGNFGVSTNFSPPGSSVDFGLYAIQYTSKAPYAYAYFRGPTAASHFYQLVYPEKIRAIAGSFSTAVDNVTVSGELVMRSNMPLTRGLIIVPNALNGLANATDNTFYPTGRTAHANLSTTVSLKPNLLSKEALLIAELAWNRVVSCDKNCVNVAAGTFGAGTAQIVSRDGNADKDAYGFRMLYVPTYRQVVSGVDLSVPLGLSYSPEGKSGAVGPMFVHKGGDISLGATATLRSAYTVALRYTHYYGNAALPLDTAGFFNFSQTLKDRNNVTLSARMSF